MKSLSNFLIVLTIWIGMLVIIGLSIHKHWGSPYGVWIPLAFLALSFREILKLGKDDKKDSAPRISKDKPSHTRDTPRTPYDITQEDIHKDLHEGRE
jgi:hypothetical protein